MTNKKHLSYVWKHRQTVTKTPYSAPILVFLGVHFGAGAVRNEPAGGRSLLLILYTVWRLFTAFSLEVKFVVEVRDPQVPKKSK